MLQGLINLTNEIRSIQELTIKLTVDFKKQKDFDTLNHNLEARREQRRSLFSLCRADAVNGDVSRNLRAIPGHSLEEGEYRLAA